MANLVGPAHRTHAPLQTRVSPELIAGKEVGIETNPGKRADFRQFLRPLNTPVEEGMKKKYTRDEVWKLDENGRSVYIRDFEKEFQKKKQDVYKIIVTREDPEKWDEANQKAIGYLNQLIDIVNRQDAGAMMDMRSNMGFIQRGGRNDIGAAASEQLASIFRRVEKEKEITEHTKREANEAIQALLKQQIGIHEALANADLNTQWDDLKPEVQAYVWRSYLNYQWAAVNGTIERNAELKVLTERENAPWRVRAGRQRQVYAAILEWRALDERLKAEKDPEERLLIRDSMRHQEEIVNRWTSDLTGTFNEREEDGAVATNQIKNGAWSEIRHTIDKLREKDGTAKNVFVQATASYSQGSWEAIDMKTNIYFTFGAAKNAFKRLQDMTPEEFAEGNFVAGKDISPANIAELYGETEKEHQLSAKELKESESKIEDAEEVAERLKDEIKIIVAETEGYRSADPSTGGATGGRSGGKGSGGGVRRDEIHDAYDRLRYSRQQLREAEHKLEDLRETHEKKVARFRLSSENFEELAEAYKNQELQLGSNELASSRSREEKVKYYKDLAQRLHAFLTQEKLHKDFYESFNENDVRTIAKLTGLEAAVNGYTKEVTLACGLANDGDIRTMEIDEKTGIASPTDKIVFSGDYAFINAWAVAEQDGQVSADIVEQMLDNPDAFPEIKALIDKAKKKGKIVIVVSFAITNDIDGGTLSRPIEGGNREFDVDAAEQIKTANRWTDAELFTHWLDDLEIQKRVGIRPEEIERRYSEWIARQHQFRQKHFNAEDKWTFINVNIGASTPAFFETHIRRMVDAGLTVDSHGWRRLQTLGRSNEYAITVTDENQNRQVYYRGQELTTFSEGAEKTLVGRVYKSLMNELELFYSRTLMGNPVGVDGSNFEGDDDATMKAGAFAMANADLLRQKMMYLEAIYQDPELNAEERLAKMVDWSQGKNTYEQRYNNGNLKIVSRSTPIEEIRRIREQGGMIVYDGDPDPGMTHLTYELVDSSGEFIQESSNPELWQYVNATAQWVGKLGRNLREATWMYAQTMTNPNATASERMHAETEYVAALGDRRNWEIRQKMLGKQFTGQLNGLDSKELGAEVASTYADITGTQMRRLHEQQMRATFELDEIIRPDAKNAMRRLVGRLAKSRVAEVVHGFNRMVGIKSGDMFLGEIHQDTIKSMVRNKMDTMIDKTLSAHMVHAYQTGYNAEDDFFGNLFNPSTSDTLYPNSDAPGIRMSETGEALFEGKIHRIKEDIQDFTDRIILDNMHTMVNVAKHRGTNIDEILYMALNGDANDTQAVEWNGSKGQFQWNMYRKKPTPMSMLEVQMLNEVAKRADASPIAYADSAGEVLARSAGHAINDVGQALLGRDMRPPDTRTVPFNRSQPSIGGQHRDSDKRDKVPNTNPLAGSGQHALTA